MRSQERRANPRRAHSVNVPALVGGFRLDLQHIALTGNHLVQHGIDEEPDEEAGDEAGHDDNSEGSLSIRSNAGGEGRWQQPKACN